MRTDRIARSVCLTAALLLLVGCAAEPQQSQTQASRLDWYVNFSWFNAGWGGNHVTDTITETTGVTVDFSTPTGAGSDTLDAMIRQGDLPDLITLGWWEPQISTLIDGGYVYSLDELAETYDPDFYTVAGADQLDWYRQPDGYVYGYPSFSAGVEEAQQAANMVFVVRKDLYEALGSPDMTTPEGFADTLRRAAAQYPEVDGKPLIPFGVGEFNEYGNASLTDCLPDFLAIPPQKDGQAYDAVTDPDYQSWLKTLRELVADGTLTSDFLFDKRQQTAEKLLDGQYFCLLYQWTDVETQLKELYATHPERMYIAVDGPRNAAGDPHTLSGVGMNGWTLTFISRSCEDPAAAIKLMHYLLSEEGQNLVRYGKEGEDYQFRDGQAVLTDAAAKLFEEDYSAYVQQIGANNTYWMLQSGTNSIETGELQQIRDWVTPYTVNISAYEIAFEPGSRAAEIDEQEKLLWGQTLPQLLLAPDEAAYDEVLQNYLNQREALGWAVLQQEQTRLMQRNAQKLAQLHDGK